MTTFRTLAIALLATMALLISACGTDDAAVVGNDDTTDTATAAPTTAATASDDAGSDDSTDSDDGTDEEDAGSDASDDGTVDDAGSDVSDDGTVDDAEAPDTATGPLMQGGTDRDFGLLPPATGEPITVGLISTEGPPGLNFPEMRTLGEATAAYLNDHGGFGGRVIDLQTCVVDASPEASQRCAQELAGKGAEAVFIGLDLFVDYATYDAEGMAVYGAIPLSPADYAAEAIFLSGGNASLSGGIVAAAVEVFDAQRVAIISGDNPGANSSELSLIASLDFAGIEYTSLKGSDAETDAGFQALVSQALSSDPDVLISLYGDAGCIGMMRGRAAVGSDVPVLGSSTCSAAEVLDAAGDDANGWYFVGGADQDITVERAAMQAAAAIDLGVPSDEVVLSELGLGGLSQIMLFTVAAAANDLAAGGDTVDGPGIYNHIKTNPDGDLRVFPEGALLECGVAAAYAALCQFETPIGEYRNGAAPALAGFESLSALPYLPS